MTTDIDGINILDLTDKHNKDDDIIKIAKALCTNTTVRTLLLINNDITDIGACALAEMLTKNTTLKTLMIQGNYIGNKGYLAIFNALTRNTSISTIRISQKYYPWLSALLDVNYTITMQGNYYHYGPHYIKVKTQRNYKNQTQRHLTLTQHICACLILVSNKRQRDY